MKFLSLIMIAALLVVSTGCGKNKNRILAPNPEFSINVIQVPKDWPDEERDWPDDDPALAAAQQEVYEAEGAPDYFRFLWHRDGRIATQEELTARLSALRKDKGAKRAFEEVDIEWLYVDKGLMYRFVRGKAEKRLMPDNVRIITEYGDPQDVKESRDAVGNTTIYQYYRDGKIFYFREGTLIREENMPAAGGMIIRR